MPHQPLSVQRHSSKLDKRQKVYSSLSLITPEARTRVTMIDLNNCSCILFIYLILFK